MNLNTLETILVNLNHEDIDYLIAGGLAVNAHGYLRFTADIDLVIALNSKNIHKTFSILHRIGYQPQVPVTAEQFADDTLREQWINNKGMKVLNFWSDQHKDTPLDIFVYEPFDFKHEKQHCLEGEVLPDVSTRFVSIPTLIEMKKTAGRPKDKDDIQHLQWILEENEE